MLWHAVIFGPDDTPWEGGTFRLKLEFTEEYPNKVRHARARALPLTDIVNFVRLAARGDVAVAHVPPECVQQRHHLPRHLTGVAVGVQRSIF